MADQKPASTAADLDAARSQWRKVLTLWLTPTPDDPAPWVGVFQNQDPGQRDTARKVAFVFHAALWDKATIGTTCSTDHGTIGLGWRYVLIAKCTTVDEALKELEARSP